MTAKAKQITHVPTKVTPEKSSTVNDETFYVKDAILHWYNEIKDYDFNRNDAKKGKGFKDIGHFTQVVWKGSTQLGIGVAKASKRTYVVALYFPHGNVNIPKMNKDNVLPLVGHSGSISIPRTQFIHGLTMTILIALKYVQ